MGKQYPNRYQKQNQHSINFQQRHNRLYRIVLWAFFIITLTWQVDQASNLGMLKQSTKFLMNSSVTITKAFSSMDYSRVSRFFSDTEIQIWMRSKINTPEPINSVPSPNLPRLQPQIHQPVIMTSSDSDNVILQADATGHYRGIALINERSVRFLVDTGATNTVIPIKVADMLGLPMGYSVQTKTAGGLVQDKATNLYSLKIGHIEIRDVYAVINDHVDEMLLGMNMLRLFQINQGNGRMTLSFNKIQSDFGAPVIRATKNTQQPVQILESSESCAHFIHLVKDGHEIVQCIQKNSRLKPSTK